MAPLLRNKPFDLRNEPESFEQIPPAITECWQIRFTLEIFYNYDDYIQRLHLYQQPVWTCAATGKENLTYEKALESERQSQDSLNRLPPPLQKRILQLIQFSLTPRLDQLVEEVNNSIKNQFFLDEPLLLTEGYRKYLDIVVLDCLPENNYRVKVVGAVPEDIRIVPATKINRQRYLTSKQNLKQYIREVASHDIYGVSPWLIKESLAKKFGIPTELPAHVLKALKRKSEDEGGSRKRKADDFALQKPRFPVEDAEIPFYFGEEVLSNHSSLNAPEPITIFSIPAENVSDLLYCWTFLYDYATSLKLAPFTLEDFESALRFSNEEHKSPIMVEVLLCIMTYAMKYFAALRARQVRAYRYIKNRPKQRSSTAIASTDSLNASSLAEEPEEDAADDDNDDSLSLHDSVEDKGNTAPLGTAQNASEFLLNEEQWWTYNLNEDTVMEIVIACLFSIGTIFDVPNLLEIMTQLTQNEELLVNHQLYSFSHGHILTQSGKDWRMFEAPYDYYIHFSSLTIADKLAILRILISECVICSDELHSVMDKTEDQALEYRKEKRDIEVMKKLKVEERKKYDEPADGKVDNSAEAFPDIDESDDSGSQDEDDIEPDSPHSKRIYKIKKKLSNLKSDDLSKISRQEKIKLQQQLRDAEEDRKIALFNRSKEANKSRNAEARAKANEKRELDIEIDKLTKREIILDRELRLYSGFIRCRPLGFDRFWNTYWWFDGYGSGISGIQEYNAYTGYSSRGTGLIGYGTGRLWVEGSGIVDFLGHVSGASGRQIGKRRKPGDDPKLDPLVTLPDGFKGRMSREVVGKNKLSSGQWGYFETQEQVDALLDWLNPKGVREQSLKTTLQKYYDSIIFNLKRRQAELGNLLNPNEKIRISTRLKSQPSYSEPHMAYVNRWADQ